MKYFLLIIFFIGLAPAQTDNPKPKHIFLKSAILPGWGEMSLQQNHRAKNFFIREGLLWLTLYGANKRHDWYRSDYLAFGAEHAGADMSDKTYQYVVDMGNYDSYDDFIAAKNRQRQIDLKYPEGQGYEWDWDSSENRIKFDDMRIKSAGADKFAAFVVAGLVFHRVVSLIDVLYFQRKAGYLSLNSGLIPEGNERYTFVVSLNF
ncbi:MAG: hypothetical protein GXO91_03160 [FCB group bacterium]|nr:hypothetical protein [FCB group bacterium]